MNPSEIRTRTRIGVIGGARPALSFLNLAYDAGRLIAVRGAVLVCGGALQAAAGGA